MRRSDLIDSNVEEHQLCGSMHCPGCGHKLEGKPDWVGLPAGVKFDPTDQELIEHLEAKVEAKEYSKSHPLIDEFITTIEGEDGICYTHPEKLPGVTRDGLSRHFFHRPSKAYTTGTRKRRKIQTETDFQGGSGGGETRWHKTGKTRPVMVNGEQKGCKKILVLYTNFGKNRKPEKTSWVMHQYHLGQDDEEKEGELVVSKIFYQTQPRQSNINWSDRVLGGGSSSNTSNSSAFCGGDQMAAAAIYGDLEVQKLKAEHFGFDPFGKSFDEVGMVGEGSAKTCQTRDHQSQMPHHVSHDHQMAPHVSRPSPSMSAIVSPPFHHLHHHHHTSINILHDHHQDNPSSFHVSSMMLQNQTCQQGQGQEQEKEQNDKVLGRSASGLEEIIMACTSTTDIKEKESSSSIITNPQEAEWLKYSSTTFWPHPHNPNHQG